MTEKLDGSRYWHERARAGYGQLGWVTAPGPLQKLVGIANLRGWEIVLDAGTGSQAVLDTLAPYITTGRIYGFDISKSMLDERQGPLPKRATVLEGDIYDIPFPDNFADLITARMVYHNLNDIAAATLECQRVLRPGGRLIVCEYVVPEIIEAREHETAVFDIKERGRNLWSGSELASMIACTWNQNGDYSRAELDFAVLRGYSVTDWMSHSGLPQHQQDEILDLYLNASEKVTKAMQIKPTGEGDVLVDRPFAFITTIK